MKTPRSPRRPLTTKILRCMLVLYCTVLVTQPFMIYFSVFYQNLQTMLTQEINLQTTAAEACITNLNQAVASADEYTAALLQMENFEDYFCISSSQPAELVSNMRNLMKTYPVFYDAGRILIDSYVYSATSNTILSPSSGYLRLYNYYENVFSLPNYDYFQWKEKILNHSKNTLFVATGDEEQNLLYSKRIGYGVRFGGRIFFRLSSQKILTTFLSLPYAQTSSIILYDQAGTPIYSRLSDAESMNPADMYTAFSSLDNSDISAGYHDDQYVYCAAHSPQHQLKLCIITPISYFHQQAMQSSAHTLLNHVPLIVINLIMSILILCFSLPHLNATVKQFSMISSIRTINPFRYVQQAASDLLDTHKEYAALLEESRHELQSAVVSELIFQKNQDAESLRQKLSKYGLSLSAPYFRAVVLMLIAHQDQSALPITQEMHARILEISGRHGRNILQYLNMNNSEQFFFVALMPEQENRFDQLRQMLRKICQEISQEMDCHAVMYIGNECNCITRISYSFKDALKLIVTSVHQDECLVYTARNSELRAIYHYTSEDEHMLQRLVKAGDDQGICRYLNSIYEKNNSQNVAMTTFEAQLFYAHMFHTLLNCGYNGPIDDACRYALHDISMEEFFSYLQAYYLRLAEQCRMDAQMKEAQEQKQVMDYIHQHYGDYQICLSSLAEHFDISERHLSVMVRNVTAMSFSDYLEKLRLEQSIALLKSTDLTIADISLQVGYSNDKSFRRAFKRYWGKTPSEIRFPGTVEEET